MHKQTKERQLLFRSIENAGERSLSPGCEDGVRLRGHAVSRGAGRVTHFSIGLMPGFLCITNAVGQSKGSDPTWQEWIGDQKQAEASKLCIFSRNTLRIIDLGASYDTLI